MSWTKSGTISLTNNSAIVYGAGTTWASSNLVRGGDILKAPDGKDYEVLSVQSNTQLTLATPYLGTTVSGQAYALIHTGLLPAELAVDVSDLQSKYLTTVAQLYEWETSTADTVPLTNPATGVTTNVKPIAQMIEGMATPTITGGTINNAPIGQSTPAAGAFTTLTASAEVTSMRQGVASDLAYKVNGNGAWEQPNLIGHYHVGRDSTRIAVPSAYLNNAFIDLDVAGNVGIGVAPSSATLPTVESAFGLFSGQQQLNVAVNACYNDGWKYQGTGGATRYYVDRAGGAHIWYSAPSGTAGQPITFTQDMTLSNGNLLVGMGSNTSASRLHVRSSGTPQGAVFTALDNGVAGSFFAYSANYYGANSTGTAIGVGINDVTSRSINAGGTVNTSGNDYAEYERNNGLVIAKGSIIGFKSDGTLTTTFADAIRFGIKSTAPSYVGGDTWGSEEQVGKRPEQPIRKADKTEQRLVSEAVPNVMDGDGIAIAGKPAVYETVVIEAGNTDAEWLATETAFATELADFEVRLEAARQQVDRVAYSGKVPVNVLGATPGGYIIAVEGDDGMIAGEFVADPDFAQYKRAVGRVNRILEDGRCEVAVMVH